MNPDALVVTVIGAGGKMGMRISANLARSPYSVFYCESHPPAQDRVHAAGREIGDSASSAAKSDIVILAVPDVVLGEVSATIVPVMRPGATLLTLDPAAAYSGRPGHQTRRAHRCGSPLPSIDISQRTSTEEWADTFGGVAAPQEVVAALDSDDQAARERTETVVRTIYHPVLGVHWVTIKQLAGAGADPRRNHHLHDQRSPEGRPMGDGQHGWHPGAAAKAMLLGHIQVALTNSLKGPTPSRKPVTSPWSTDGGQSSKTTEEDLRRFRA